jgi:hypothetical protein
MEAGWCLKSSYLIRGSTLSAGMESFMRNSERTSYIIPLFRKLSNWYRSKKDSMSKALDIMVPPVTTGYKSHDLNVCSTFEHTKRQTERRNRRR